MKTMNSIGKFMAGELFGIVMWLIVLAVDDIANGYSIDWSEAIFYTAITIVITLAITYLGYHIGSGIRGDVADFKKWRMERSLEGEAA